MRDGESSRTAERVAKERAAHQLVDGLPRVLDDPLSIRLISAEQRAALEAHPEQHDRSPISRPTRAMVVVRTRIAEDEMSRSGAAQYVLLGAGFDTFAYRNPNAGLRVFEVDHPVTQAAKRQRLATAGITMPNNLAFVPCDFSRQHLADALDASGFNRARPTVFAWLGVVMYLDDADVDATLRYIARLPATVSVVFDYAQPPEAVALPTRMAYQRMLEGLAERGEPWKSFMAPDSLRSRLVAAGFSEIEDVGAAEINARYLTDRTDGLRCGGIGRVVVARRTAQLGQLPVEY